MIPLQTMDKWPIEQVLEAVGKIEMPAVAFGTTDFLPEYTEELQAWVSKPENRKYEKLADSIFAGIPAKGSIELRDGVEKEKAGYFIRAHLNSFVPKHEHKTAGVAFLIYQITDRVELD